MTTWRDASKTWSDFSLIALSAADQFDDPAVLDHDAALGPLGEHRDRVLDPQAHLLLASRKKQGGSQRHPRRNHASTLAATTSTSTRNSGRVKPETIIKVEAGGGVPTVRSRTAIYPFMCSRPVT